MKNLSFSFRTLLCFVFLAGCTTTPAYGQKNTQSATPQLGLSTEAQHNVDSMLSILPSLQGDDKMDTYTKLDRQIRSGTNHDFLIGILYEFKKEADLLKNYEKAGFARIRILEMNFRAQNVETTIQEAPGYLKFFLDHDLMSRYWTAAGVYVSAMIYRDQLSEALEFIRSAYDIAVEKDDPAGKCMMLRELGLLYHIQKNDEAGLKALEESYGHIKQVEDPELRATLYNRLANRLAPAYSAEPQKAVAILSEWKNFLIEDRKREWEAYGNNDNGDLSAYQCNLQLSTAYAYLKEFEKADACLNEALPYIDIGTFSRHNFYLHKTIYYQQKEDYAGADSMLRKCREITRRRGDISQLLSETTVLREIQIKLGKYEEAAALGDSIFHWRDSLVKTDHLAQINELRTRYDVDTLEAQKERQRILILWAVTGCLLLGALALLLVWHSSRLRRKNLSLYRQIQERAACEYNVEMAVRQIPEQELTREQKLFRNLRELMDDEKLFTTPNLDRNALAERLGTNRQYLADAVKQGSGLTLGAYMADLRLKYALELLSNNKDLTLEAIAEETGHASYSPFFKAFTQKYGMNPSEYRKLSATGNGANKAEPENQHPE